jgi:hypothetical protein
MKSTKNGNGSQKREAVKAYVDSQISILRKHGTEVSPSSRKYKQIVRQVARASAS